MPPIDVLANWKTIQAAKQKREEEQKKREQEKPARAARAQRDGAEERKSRTVTSIAAAEEIKEIYRLVKEFAKRGINPIDTKTIRELPFGDREKLRKVRKYMLDYGMYKLADNHNLAIQDLSRAIREIIPEQEAKNFRKVMGWKSPVLAVADFFRLWKRFKKYKGIDGLLLLSNENISMESITTSIPPKMRIYLGWPVVKCSNEKFSEAVAILREYNPLSYLDIKGMIKFSEKTGIDNLNAVYSIASALNLVEKLGWVSVLVTRQKFEEARDKLIKNRNTYKGISGAKKFSEEIKNPSPHVIYTIALALGLTKKLGWKSLGGKSDFSKL